MKLIPMIVALGLLLSLCNLVEKFKGGKNENGSSSSSSTEKGKSDKNGLPPADKPEPTAAQSAAIAGGQSVTWNQQAITWTLPAKWTEVSNSSSVSFNWKSPGSWDAGFIIGSISPMGADFPTDISLKATFDGAVADQKNGKYEEVKWLELDGIRGILTREPLMESKDDARRLQWRAYRKYAGQVQLISIILSSQSQHFDMHKDALHGILYSTKIVHE
jgi:hypothetical protein